MVTSCYYSHALPKDTLQSIASHFTALLSGFLLPVSLFCCYNHRTFLVGLLFLLYLPGWIDYLSLITLPTSLTMSLFWNCLLSLLNFLHLGSTFTSMSSLSQ